MDDPCSPMIYPATITGGYVWSSSLHVEIICNLLVFTNPHKDIMDVCVSFNLLGKNWFSDFFGGIWQALEHIQMDGQ